MTLSTVSRYDEARVRTVGERAVVVGGSVAGLLAGRVLADGFREVVVLERDSLDGAAVPRRGVPQAAHVHVLLEAGRATIEDLLPGFGEALLSSGGVVIDVATDLAYHHEGDSLAEGPKRLPMYCATRPLFERAIRERVADLEGVTVRPNCLFRTYLTDDAANVEGVVVANADGESEHLAADLVVDATGRTSRTPDWLDRHGYARPPATDVDVDLAYSTTLLERPPDDRRAVLAAPSPPTARGGTAVPVEGDRWIVTLFGLHGDHPPTDREGFESFAAGLPTAALGDLLDDHRWVSEELAHYPFPSNRRRRYEALDRFPEGLLVTGDAVASFNPIYGQGMSVAVLDALQLHHALAAGGRVDLASRFFDRVASTVDVVWRMTVGADFAFPQTEGPRPPGTGLFNRYLSRLVRTAHADGYVADRFARVLRLERRPAALLEPDVLWRVLLPSGVRRRG